MALVLADRIQETASAPGTATVTLGGASLGYKTFASGVGSGNTTYYTIVDATANVWEVGVGTVGTGTLSRDTVLSNSSGTTAKINFANSVTVWCDYPAGKAVYLDESNVLTLSVPEVISVNSSSNALRITQTGAGNALVVEDSANPDSTPFVVDANGLVVIGNTTAIPCYGFNNQLELLSTGNSYQLNASFRNDAFSNILTLAHSRNGTIGSHAVVQSGDDLGALAFAGSDGTAFIRGAQISAQVDGTPGTNDMPGRLVFSTTADGASSPTERMRIDNAGRVGIGGTPPTGVNFLLAKTISGASTSYGFWQSVVADSTVTSNAFVFSTNAGTAAQAFTLSNLYHYRAGQSAIGAGSAVTNQYGFISDSTLTGATNNYGFYSGLAAGTGRWNFYAAGTADNYFAGKLGVGSVPYNDTQITISSNGQTGTTNQAVVIGTQIPSTATSVYYGILSYPTTQAAAFTLTSLRHFQAAQSTIGAGSTVTNQYGFFAENSLTGATNNYGFYSNIASGTGRYNFYAAGTAANYFAGSLGVGGVPVAGYNLLSTGNWTGSTTYYGVASQGTIQSDVTATAFGYRSSPNTQAAVFTLGNLIHYGAEQGAAIGAGSVITNQHGHWCGSLTAATNNFGFYSNIASGTGRWNFYAAGSAANYFAGDVTCNTTLQGSAVSASNGLFVNNNTVSANYSIPSSYNASSAGPVTVASGITVTIPSGSNWVII